VATTLKWLEVLGFRSFGVAQRLDFAEPLALIWGANSQGKTSVAEAVEFLLTGTTVRREMLGGDKGEYDDSLRNAYHPDSEEVSVTACIVRPDGAEHLVKRTLDCDYSRKQDCETTLTVDGVEKLDVSCLGIALAEPPLRAPVLFQHSVRYALSSRPTDRLTYFKALLEMTDLDLLTSALTKVVDGIRTPETPLERDLATAAVEGSTNAALAALLTQKPTRPEVQAAVESAVGVALAQVAEPPVAMGASFDEKVAALDAALESQGQRQFDFAAWRPGSTPPRLPTCAVPATSIYREAASKADAEAERLRALFDAVLALPAIAEADDAVDCPVCETPSALSPSRIQALRDRVRNASGFRQAQAAAIQELQALRMQLAAIRAAGETLTPRAAAFDEEQHRAAAANVTSLVGAERTMEPTRSALAALSTKSDALQTAVTSALQEVDDALRQTKAGEDVDTVKLADVLSTADGAAETAGVARERQVEEAGRVLVPVREALEKQTNTSVASATLRLAKGVDDLLLVLRKRFATASVRAEYDKALKDVERAKLAVFNAKFSGMSVEIARWWNLLRPNEPVAFHRAAPRGSGRRFVALEAKLSSNGREEVRDALGVLSDSQLNALGVAAFLARAVLQETPFVVLDDPLQSGDDEHRDTFIDCVIPELLDSGMQVLVMSYDSQFKRLLTNAQPLDGFTVTLDDPTAGTVVVKGTDTAEALLKEAKAFLKDAPSLRETGAGRLRTAAERVAKEILVVKRTAVGDRASLSDYTKQSLEKLVPQLEEHLTDEREQGKWKNVSPRLSPGAHDDEPPAKNTLRTVYDHLLDSHRKHVRDAPR
jgi:hypothetical protein